MADVPTPEELQEKAKEIQRLRYATDPQWRQQVLDANKRYYNKKKEEAIAAGMEVRPPGRPRKYPRS
jgi:hypothetical protein